MTIPVQCSACSKEYELRDELAGKKVRCKACGGEFSVPHLRTKSDNAADRSQLPSMKAVPVKPSFTSTTDARSPSSKSVKDVGSKPSSTKPTTAKSASLPITSAKQKPPTKPKPASKKYDDDDLFEDDDEFDDVIEVADTDDVENDQQFTRRTPESSRSRGKKNARKKKKSGPSVASAALSFFAGSFVWWAFLAGILTCAGFAWAFYSDPLGSKPLAQTVVWVGLPLLCASAIWMIVVTFRVSPGWGIAYIVGCLANIGLNMTGHPAIAGGLTLCFWVINLILIVQHWSEFRAVFLFQFVLGMFLVTPLVAVIGIDRMRQDFEDRIPTAAGTAGELPKPDAPFNVASIPLPRFNEMRLSVIQGHEYALINTDHSGLQAQTPGVLTLMTYWQPGGRHADHSLACVLVASAGSTLLHGATVPDVSYVAETRPYVDAGFAVLGVSLDGPILDKDRATDRDYSRAYDQFRRSGAGTVNVRNAVEFLIQKVPQVDPGRIYIAGHSSAATLALLAAEHEPRLKGCVAYAPATDVVARLKNVTENSAASKLLPGVAEFAKQSSPLTHVSKVGCPVFLFHATDDSNVPVSDSRRFAELLKANGKQIDYVEVPTGNHYDSMIQQGIPRAIPWLKQLASSSGSNAAPAVAQDTSTPRPNSGVTPVPALPQLPFTNLPQNSNAARQPSGRMVTFRFQSFGGQGDATAAARQALRNVTWADLNDVEVDAAKGEVRIGQLGGVVNTETGLQALRSAGFQMLPGVSIGSKSSIASTVQPPKNDAPKPATATVEIIPEVPAKNPPAKPEASKPTPAVVPPANNPPEKRPGRATARRVVTFRYERFTGKGASANAMREALKRIEWADQEDIVMDASKKEIRIGLLNESANYERARKALTNQGFSMSVGETTSTTKD